jgi:plasmid maintenance system antidote protein VapI
VNALARYFSETGETPSALASRMGKPVSTVTRLLNGQRGASPKLAIEIEQGTNGRVKAVEIMQIGLHRAEQAREATP